jgi:C4-dicarboxylate-specific signal transduction histidine kinase
MSSAGVQLTRGEAGALNGRTPLAHLLHALNQPLTGLQCSLELAVVRPRSGEEDARTMREALDLTSRMRVLVETLREIGDAEASGDREPSSVCLNDLLAVKVEELIPVADALGIRLRTSHAATLQVCGTSSLLSEVFFRLLDSALSLARPKSDLLVAIAAEQGSAVIRVGWSCGPLPEFSPFSRQELGLLIARAVWEHEGGVWSQVARANEQTCELRMPRMTAAPDHQTRTFTRS